MLDTNLVSGTALVQSVQQTSMHSPVLKHVKDFQLALIQHCSDRTTCLLVRSGSPSTTVSNDSLVFSVCDASTGQNLASFIFNRLKQINAPFSNLFSLSTGGASNMVGRFNGLLQCFKTLVQQEHGTIPCAISQVWCLAHRLNLVIRDFQDVKNINSVFDFCDWFTEKRKAVTYRKFLREKYQERRFKKITKPSKTRWSFYKDVLEGILSQPGEVEAFLKQDGDFIRTRPGSFHLSDVSVRTSVDYFSNRFVLMHFKFALSTLKKNWCHERRSTRTVHAFTRGLDINKSFETVILRLSQSNEKWRFQRFRFYRLGKPRREG